MDIEELAADMRAAAGFDDPSSRGQSIEASAAVGVQDTGEGVQLSSRMLAFAVGRVEEDCRGQPSAFKVSFCAVALAFLATRASCERSEPTLVTSWVTIR
jgi:hypothetical protein